MKRLWRGMRGHPGNLIMLWLVGLGAVAGLDRGEWGALVGAALMLLIFGPIYLIGAYAAGKQKGA